MSLTPNTRLGPYEILGPLGAGGMGEVYRARDMRLERTVAIIKSTPEGQSISAWLVSVLSGAASPLRDDAVVDSVSPDGSLIAFRTGGPDARREIWVMGPRGEDARRIVAGDSVTFFDSVLWLPDSQHIVYVKTDTGPNAYRRTLVSRDLKDSAPSVIPRRFSGRRLRLVARRTHSLHA